MVEEDRVVVDVEELLGAGRGVAVEDEAADVGGDDVEQVGVPEGLGDDGEEGGEGGGGTEQRVGGVQVVRRLGRELLELAEQQQAQDVEDETGVSVKIQLENRAEPGGVVLAVQHLAGDHQVADAPFREQKGDEPRWREVRQRHLGLLGGRRLSCGGWGGRSISSASSGGFVLLNERAAGFLGS